ncbi:MAG: hypothetical protein ACLPZR_12235 [Solirubrobacteraceae bacterium]
MSSRAARGVTGELDSVVAGEIGVGVPGDVGEALEDQLVVDLIERRFTELPVVWTAEVDKIIEEVGRACAAPEATQ